MVCILLYENVSSFFLPFHLPSIPMVMPFVPFASIPSCLTV